METAINTTQKIGVRSVKVHRAEGPSHLCRTHTFKTLRDANLFLIQSASTVTVYPDCKGGYDKHDFWIEFEDGETYQGRIDLHHPSYAPTERIGKHVRDFVRFYGGLLGPDELPRHIKPREYMHFVAMSGADPVEYRAWLEKYELSD
jgi:hypothetical protein